MPNFVAKSRVVSSVLLLVLICTCLAYAAISLSTGTAATQNFDGIGTIATAVLPADFRVDKPSVVRTVGTFAGATSNTTAAGGANLSSTAANGIYNFGSGTTTTGSDRAIGFLSSGTATASGNLYAQYVNNTGTSLSGLKISYNVEKYRTGSNPAGFRIQLFYSTDGATWVSAGSNFLTSFPADAANAGYANAPGVTVAITNQPLTVTIPNGTNFYLAWNYSVATGSTTTNAQALAVDDISVLGLPPVNTPTNPAGVGSSGTVQAGNAALLTMTVTPGANPTSTGLAVTADLSSIGGSASQQFFDNGTFGDVTAGDNIFSFSATVPAATTSGAKSLPATITDAQGRSGSASISVNVTPSSTPPTGVGAAAPSSLQEGNTTLLTVKVTSGTNPPSTGVTVFGNLSSIGGSHNQQFLDNGLNGDAAANDGIYSFQIAIASGTTQGGKSLAINLSDAQGRTNTATIALTIQPPPPPTTVKISQVYGGGGNSGSTYTNDFIEIFNQATTPVNITGWSVQYSSAGATSWAVTKLCATGATCFLAPGHYFLVQESKGNGGTTPLPTADVVGDASVAGDGLGIAMSGTQAKVALVASTTPLSGACPSGGAIADMVGYGVANCSETVPTPVVSATTAAVRKGNGCVDTDNNLNDFVIVGPIPRNSASPANSCGGDPTQPSGLGIGTPGSLDPASNTLLTVKVTPATTPASTGIAVSADVSSIGGASSQVFFDDGTNGDQVAGDNIFSFQQTVGAFIPTGAKSVVATITDSQGRTATAPITLTVASPTCGVERWSVKTGTDPDAALIDLSKSSRGNIENLGALTPPTTPPDNARFGEAEFTQYVLNATMTFFKKEGDVDYHIVLQDDALPAHTLIAEIPSPACVGPTSPLGALVSAARKKFDARFAVTDQFQQVLVPVQIKGIGFFDFIHGQNGVAPNGIELHSVTEINFTANTTTTLMSSASPTHYGESVAITGTVSNGTSTLPTGTLSFTDGATPIGTAIINPSGQATITTSTLPAGTHSITASYDGDSTSAPSVSSALLQVVNKADQSITFGALSGKVYGAADFSVSASASSGLPVVLSIFSGPATISGNSVHITGAGSITVRASQAGDDNHNAASDVDQSFEVSKASQQITFAALADKTYGDAAFTVSATGGASGNAVNFVAAGNCASSGVNGSTITISGGGSCSVTASQAGNSNYDAAEDVARTFTIKQAAAIVTVSGYTGVYDGNQHGASGSATGVNGEDLTSMLNLGAAFIDVPGGTAHWSFAGDSNYKPSSGDAVIAISQATPTIHVSGYSGTYDGHAHGAAGSAAGVSNEDLSSLLNLGASFTDVPGGTAHWTFAGNTNYPPASGDAAITITQALANIAVSGYSGTYDGHAHGATGSATGVSGENLSSLLNFGSTFTTVPGGTAHWTFAGNTNYPAASGDAAITITQASANIAVSGYNGIYDGGAHGASGSATGVSGENLSALLNLGASFTNVPGGTANWTFAGNGDYSASSGTAAIVISAAAPSFSNISSPVIVYGTGTTTLSGRISNGSLIPTGSVNVVLNGVTQSAAIQPNGSFSSAFATGNLAATTPPYGVAYNYAGDNNFTAAIGSGTLTVTYGWTALYDASKSAQSGSTIPLKIALTNAAGSNVSSSSVAVTAVRLTQVSTNSSVDVQDSGNANPDGNFRFVGDGTYIFNLSTKGLASGTWQMVFRVSGDPQEHALTFQIR
ncbi:MAG: hypothetical protein JWO13_3212 [Acidobacteriales bacterium]|nr:hypothetical protein [Terriglobales bacterium]